MSFQKKQNVDLSEIEKFELMASRWWDLEGEFKPLHQINPLRLQYLMEISDGIFGKNILDVGCGGGILAESMAREGAIVTGIDMAKEPLAIAKAHSLQAEIPISYVQETAEDHSYQHTEQYDIITCMEMLEHVPDPESVVRACAEMVKPGGDVFLSTLNRNVKSWLFAIVGAEYIMNMVPKGTHNFDKFIRPSELLKMLDGTSLIAMNMSGLHYNPFSKNYFLSSQNIDVNYLVHCKKMPSI